MIRDRLTNAQRKELQDWQRLLDSIYISLRTNT